MAHIDSPQDTGNGGRTPDTEKRKARKRELDRISQQRKRKNDRETISRLKAQVKALEQQSDDNHVYNLVLKQEKDQEKLNRHLERMKHIEALVEADLKDLGKDEGQISASLRGCNPVKEAQNENDTHRHVFTAKDVNGPSYEPAVTCIQDTQAVEQPRSHLDAMTWDELTDGVQSASPDGESNKQSPEDYMDLEDIAALDGVLPSGVSVDIPELPPLPLSLDNSHAPDWAIQGASMLADSEGVDCHRCDSMWTVCDTAIVQGRGLLLYSSENSVFDEGDAHVIITAITEGWSKAAKSQYWNRHWDSLRQIDQFCHAMCGPVERMSGLYTLLRLFKVWLVLISPAF